MMKMARGIGCVVCVLICGFVVYGVLDAVNHADRSERCLHSVLCVTSALERFVQEHSRWPTSWRELETVDSVDHENSMYEWPDDSGIIREHVTLSFDVSLADINPESLAETVITVDGPCFPYAKYFDRLQLIIAQAQKAQAER